MALSSAIGLSLYGLMASGDQEYSDIIVGQITWLDSFKSREYYVLLAFFASFLILWMPLNALLGHSGLSQTEPVGEDQASPLRLLMAGAIGYVSGMALLTGKIPSTEAWLVAAIAVAALLLTPPVEKGWQHLESRFIPALLVVLFSYFSLLSLLTVVEAVHPHALTSHRAQLGVGIHWIIAGVAMLVGFFLLLGRRVSDASWGRALYASQIITPGLILVILNVRFHPGAVVVGPQIPVYTTILLVGLATLGVAQIGWQFLREWRLRFSSWRQKMILTPSLLAVATFMHYRPPGALDDDFHIGEVLIPWQQIREFQVQLWTEHVSPQGWLGVLYGLINDVLFSDQLITFNIARFGIFVLAAVLSVYLIAQLLGNNWALLFALIPVPVTDRSFMVLPILVVLVLPVVVSSRLRWLTVWALLSTIHCFFSPIIGVALTLGTLPVAMAFAWKAIAHQDVQNLWRSRPKELLAVAVALVVVALVALPPLPGFISYLLENGSGNTISYGITVGQTTKAPEWILPQMPSWLRLAVFQVIRIGGWIIGALLLWLALIWHFSSHKAEGSDPRGPIISLSSFLFCLAVVPYTMGRLDTAGLSRTGYMSVLVLTGLLPLALLLTISRLRHSVLFALGLGLCIGILAPFRYQDPGKLYLRATATIISQPTWTYLDGSALGLPQLGSGYWPPKRADEFLRFVKALDVLLKPGESYYDMTNRALFYYVSNREAPAPYAGDYYAATDVLQERVLRSLQDTVPPIIWVGPSIRHDGGPASLRAYRIYRWAMESGYLAHEREGFQFLIHPNRYKELDLPPVNAIENAGKLRNTFHRRDLAFIPVAWGRNLDHLANRFEAIEWEAEPISMHSLTLRDGLYQVTGEDPQVLLKLNPAVNGSRYDFMAISFTCDIKTSEAPLAQIFWAGDGLPISADRVFRFFTHDGVLLVPVGSHPEWLFQKAIHHLRFDIEKGCASFHLNGIRMLRLVK